MDLCRVKYLAVRFLQWSTTVRFLNIFFLLLVLSVTVNAVPSKIIQGDLWKTNDLSKTYTPPAATDTLVGRSSVDILTNKNEVSASMSGTTSFNGVLNFNNNAVPVSGAGVDFTAGTPSPTTVSSTTNVKMITKFEMGTWTPSFVGSVSSPITTTYNSQKGTFTRINNNVCVTGWIDINTVPAGSGAGNLFVSGTPFVADTAQSGGAGGATVTYKNGWVLNGPDFLIAQGGTHAFQVFFDNNTANGTLAITNISGSTTMGFIGCYQTTE